MVTPDIGAILERVHHWQQAATQVAEDARPAQRRMAPTLRRMARNEAAFALFRNQKGALPLTAKEKSQLQTLVVRHNKPGKPVYVTEFEAAPNVKSAVTAALME